MSRACDARGRPFEVDLIAYFALGDVHSAERMLRGRSILFSFAYVGSRWLHEPTLNRVIDSSERIMIDSGAFTAWRQGRLISLDIYAEWLRDAPPRASAISLDVIGDANASVRNWRTLRASFSAIIPVWHEGDPPEHLDEYVESSELIALGRIDGRRSEQKTLEFYDAAFNRHPEAKFHALGNANPGTLEPYPFASFDSTGWQRDAAYSNAARWPFNRASRETRMMAYIEATETIAFRPARQTGLFAPRFTAKQEKR